MKEVLKLALEALEMVKANADDWQERTGKEIKGWMQPVNNAITAIKEALAQPEQEPVAYVNEDTIRLLQEPTASGFVTTQLTRHKHDVIRGVQIPVFTFPPKPTT